MKTPIIYLDSSVYGGYHDDEFSVATIPLFEEIYHGAFFVIVSKFVLEEMECAPARVRNVLDRIPHEYVLRVSHTRSAQTLADDYIQERVVGKSSFADCLHVATATVAGAEMLVSWNCKHMVNVHRIRNYNIVNMKHGYPVLDIRTPEEVTHCDFDDNKNNTSATYRNNVQ